MALKEARMSFPLLKIGEMSLQRESGHRMDLERHVGVPAGEETSVVGYLLGWMVHQQG